MLEVPGAEDPTQRAALTVQSSFPGRRLVQADGSQLGVQPRATGFGGDEGAPLECVVCQLLKRLDDGTPHISAGTRPIGMGEALFKEAWRARAGWEQRGSNPPGLAPHAP